MFAHWGRRVGASVLDVVFLLPAWVVMITGIAITASSVDPDTGDPTSSLGLGLLGAGWLAAVVLSIWNRCFRAGRTGQSWGKKVVGIRLVRESDGQPVGVGLAFGRELAHVADSPFYLGYLWPLWDPKRQTFADKICTTVVLAR